MSQENVEIVRGVYDLSDSKVVRYRQYESRTEALEAVGLSE